MEFILRRWLHCRKDFRSPLLPLLELALWKKLPEFRLFEGEKYLCGDGVVSFADIF